MNHFFVDPSQIGDARVRITGSDVRHIRDVLRLKPGEELSVSNGVDDREYRCGILAITEEEVLCELRFIKEAGVELPLRISLYQALPKADKMELIVQKAVELGVARIVPVKTQRCVVQLDEKKYEKKRERWQAIACAAAKQSRRAYIPAVERLYDMREAVAEAAVMDMALIPYERQEGMSGLRAAMRQSMSLAKEDRQAKLAVLIGPEGGFDEAELGLAGDAGIAPVSLGRRILRTETAGLCLLSHIMLSLESEGDKQDGDLSG